MEIEINKQTAKTLRRAIRLFMFGCIKKGEANLDYENMKALKTTPEELYRLLELDEQIKGYINGNNRPKQADQRTA